MVAPWDIECVEVRTTKHFALKYMCYWNWDLQDLRDALRQAYKIEKINKQKFEVYVQKSGFKKIITVYYDEENIVLCITGSEGGKRI